MNDTQTITRRTLIPATDCITEETLDRIAHRDVADLSPEQAWAEAELLTGWLANAIFNRARPRYLFDDVTDQSWAREHLRRLRAVMTGRRVA